MQFAVFTLPSGRNRGFSCQNNRSHVALHACNLGAKTVMELFKSSKDAASLLLCTRKNFLVGWYGFFM